MNDEKFQEYRRKALKYYDKKQRKHVLKVEEISLMLCDIAKLSKEERYIVSLGALLHDVCKPENKSANVDNKYKNKNKHHLKSAKFLEECFFKNVDDDIDINTVLAIVRYHKGKIEEDKDFPFTNVQLISIVRLADKISKVYKIKKTKKIVKTLDETMEDSLNLWNINKYFINN